MSQQFEAASFKKMPVIGIMRNFSYDTIQHIIPIYLKAGFNMLEITMNSKEAESIIRKISHDFPEIIIGAGTVCDTAELSRALDSGAQFIVTPIIDEEVIKICVSQQVPIFPGAFSPTEIYKAWKLGAFAVKVFPSSQFGSSYIKEVNAPLDKIPLLPTGGVSLSNITEFLQAGAAGFGMGSTLFDKRMIAEKDWDVLYAHFCEIYSVIQEFKSASSKSSDE